jgi:YVTN family beta-propeller protein
VPAAHAASWQALVTDASFASTSATPIDLGTNVAGSPIATGGPAGLGVAISPDARTAYVVNAAQSGLTGQITPIDLTSSPPVAEASIDIPNSPGNFIAIAPDGRKAYVTDPADGKVFPIDLTTTPATVGAPIAVGGNPEGVAFSPDGSRAYVAENANTSGAAEVLPITVATDAVGTAITNLGPHPFWIAITPDGAKAYVSDAGSGTSLKVYPVSLPAGTVGTPISVGASTNGIAITPDGTKAYAASGANVVPIDVSSDTAGTPIPVAGGAYAVAITPDSKTVYVTDDTGGKVTPITVATNTAGTPISSVGGTPRGIAITPDQAPVANFTVSSSPPGSPTTFNASASTVRFGAIARYDWDFGDGSTLPNGGPNPSHTYAAVGSYTAAVTETDNNGTSVSGEVYTGQSASSVGSPTARTSRSVVITNAPAPGVLLSASSVDFGTVGVGKPSAPRTLTLTNTGNGPLRILSSQITGPAANDFKLSTDTCSGQIVPASGTCAATITFTPAAVGGRSAQLAFSDNASGSPHTISLSGSGTNTGTLSGSVLLGSNGAPVPGAVVFSCGVPGDTDCRTSTSDARGRYVIGGLAPGQRDVEALPNGGIPGGGSLSSASVLLAIVAGPNAQDFVLSVPQPITAGVSFQTPGGTLSNGVPVVNWNQPFGFDAPVHIPAHADPNSIVVLPATGAVGLNPGDGTNGGFSLGSSAFLTVAYDSQGRPLGITGADDSAQTTAAAAQAAGAQPVARAAKGGGAGGTIGKINDGLGLIPKVDYAPKNGLVSYVTTTIPLPYSASLKLTAKRTEVYTSLKARPTAEPDYVTLTPLPPEIHQPVGDACDEAFKAFQAAWPALRDSIIRLWQASLRARDLPASNSSATTRSGQAALAAAPPAGRFATDDKANTALGNAEAQAISAAYPDSGSAATTPGMSAQVLIGGSPIGLAVLSNRGAVPLQQNGSPAALTVRFTVPALGERVHGSFNWSYRTPQIAITFSRTAPASASAARIARLVPRDGESCPVPPPPPPPPPGPNGGGGGGGYIDPSGSVITRTGAPLADATVTLTRRASGHGPLSKVPNGSSIMSPSNRRNPDHTDALGHFGWDVLPGFYQVTASHPGCTGRGGRTAKTAVLAVPPPVADLRLVLRCPRLHRNHTRLVLRVVNRAGGGVTVLALLHSRRAAAGFVTFRLGRRLVGTAVVDSRRHMATLTSSVTVGRRPVVAVYSGDAHNAPARGRSRQR